MSIARHRTSLLALLLFTAAMLYGAQAAHAQRRVVIYYGRPVEKAGLFMMNFRGGPAFKMKGDPRITRVGKWLRKFSFDEFPQIWNVLKGEMSLIGPRPQVMAEANGNPEWAKRRYRILPGITGLWQVSGRADLSYEDMMKLDIYYLENWSPGMDLRILLKTTPVVAFSKGAY
jgi:lipopolysaccharide/colanic/teichoic acid biosynthesis glycosyltransferase